jgi:ABC-type amino acid transport substrate-binding protein
MKFRLTLVTALLAVGAFAADATGKWSWEAPGRGGNPGRTQTMTLKVDGATLTGEMQGPQGGTPITDGKVDGDKISFTVVREFQGNSMKMNYTGTVAGDEMKLKVVTEGADRPPREFTAKREK